MGRFQKHVFAGLAAGLVAALAGTAHAQKITLRVADSLPVGHYAVTQGLKPWMDEVTRATNGEVTFQHFPSEQLGKAKDLLSLTSSGVVDVGYIQPAYVGEKMPLSAVVELPVAHSTSCAATAAYWAMGKEGGLLARQEFKPNGVRLVFSVVLAPYQVLMTGRKIDSVASFEGMKLRTAGTTQDSLVRKLKGVPVRIAGPEMYEALSRGTADGVILPLASVISYDLQNLVKHSTYGESFGTTAINYMISETRWRALPEKTRAIMLEAGEKASMKTCAYIDRESEHTVERLRKAGVTVEPLPEAEGAALRKVLARTAEEWAENLDKKGKPGTKILEAYTNRAGG